MTSIKDLQTPIWNMTTKPTCIIDKISEERYIPISSLKAEIEEKRKQYIPGTDYTDGVLMGITLVIDIINNHKKQGEEND